MKGDMGCKNWANVAGLRSKWFWYDEKNCKCGGIYTFFNMEAVEAYKKTEVFKGMWHFPFIKSETIVLEVHENCAGGELTAEMGCWPVSKGGPLVFDDLKTARLLMPTFTVDHSKMDEKLGKGMNKFRNMLSGGATSYWSGVPGLYNKWFTIGPDGADAGTGMYIFKT